MNVLSLFDGLGTGYDASLEAGLPISTYMASEVDKHALAVAEYWHRDNNYEAVGDVRLLKGGDFGSVDIMMGGSPCFVADTKIITSEGYKNISDVRVGDLVMTHKNRYRPVIAVGNQKSEIIEVSAQGARLTTTTENHPFYVRRMKRKWVAETSTYKRVFSEPEWIDAGQLRRDDFLGMPINKESSNSLNLSKEECYILGRYIADGHTRKDFRRSECRPKDRYWQLILSIGSHKLATFNERVKSYGGTLHYSAYKHSKSVHRIVYSNKNLVLLAEKYCGIGAKNKVIPQLFIDLPVDLLDAVITGYMDGDGGMSKDGWYYATSISEELIMSLNQAVAKLYKVNSSFCHYKRPKSTIIEGRVVRQSDTYSIRFRKSISKQSNAKIIGDMVWVRFRKKENLGRVETVYNLTVADDNSYTANNLTVHNCQSVSVAGKQSGIEAHTLEGYLELKQKGFEFKGQSYLFWEFVRSLNEVKPKYFILENVRMKQDFYKQFCEVLGFEAHRINSSLVSAQRRDRYYWVGKLVGKRYEQVDIPMPDDRGILLKDIVHEFNDGIIPAELLHTEKAIEYMNRKTRDGRCHWDFGHHSNTAEDKAHAVVANIHKDVPYNVLIDNLNEYIVPFDKTLKILKEEVKKGKIGYFRQDSQANRVYTIHDKAITLCGEAGGGAAKMGQYLFGCITPDRVNKRQNGQRFNDGNKFYTLTLQDRHGVLVEGYIRKITPVECERLQTLPDDRTKYGLRADGRVIETSATQRYRMLGNGWTRDVVVHILKHLGA